MCRVLLPVMITIIHPVFTLCQHYTQSFISMVSFDPLVSTIIIPILENAKTQKG